MKQIKQLFLEVESPTLNNSQNLFLCSLFALSSLLFYIKTLCTLILHFEWDRGVLNIISRFSQGESKWTNFLLSVPNSDLRL